METGRVAPRPALARADWIPAYAGMTWRRGWLGDGAQAPLLFYVSAPSFPRKREPTGAKKLCKGLGERRAGLVLRYTRSRGAAG